MWSISAAPSHLRAAREKRPSNTAKLTALAQ